MRSPLCARAISAGLPEPSAAQARQRLADTLAGQNAQQELLLLPIGAVRENGRPPARRGRNAQQELLLLPIGAVRENGRRGERPATEPAGRVGGALCA
jgi:hypothetical protein